MYIKLCPFYWSQRIFLSTGVIAKGFSMSWIWFRLIPSGVKLLLPNVFQILPTYGHSDTQGYNPCSPFSSECEILWIALNYFLVLLSHKKKTNTWPWDSIKENEQRTWLYFLSFTESSFGGRLFSKILSNFGFTFYLFGVAHIVHLCSGT